MAWSSDPGAVPLGARPLAKPNQENKGGAIERIVETSLEVPLAMNLNSNIEGALHLRRKGVRRCHKCEDNFKPLRCV